jgi:hypothetical protein
LIRTLPIAPFTLSSYQRAISRLVPPKG